MKLMLCCMIVLLPFAGVFAQSGESKRIHYGLLYAPAITAQQEHGNSELPRYGFAAGLTMRKRLADKVHVGSGLTFVNRGYRKRKEQLSWASADPSYPKESQTVYSYRFVEIPLNVYYQVYSEGNLQLNVMAGTSFNLLLNKATKVRLRFPDGSRDTDTSSIQAGSRFFGIGGMIGFGSAYALSDKVKLTAAVSYWRSFTAMAIDAGVKDYQSAGMLSLGVSKALK